MAQAVKTSLEDVIGEASVERTWEHMEWMSREVPTRVSGWEPARRQAGYLSNALGSCGFDAHQDVFPGLVAFPRPGKLVMTIPREQEIEGYTFAHSISTPAEGLEGELLFVGAGGEADYDGKDARGKIVLAELSYAPPRPEKTWLTIRFPACSFRSRSLTLRKARIARPILPLKQWPPPGT